MSPDHVGVIDGPVTTLGEGPMWSVRDEALFWIDIVGKQIHRLRPATREVVSRPLPYAPSALFPMRSGGMLLVTKKGLATFEFESGTLKSLPAPAVDTSKEIFNDGKCDSRGRLWIGTRDFHTKEPVGNLFRMDADFAMTPLSGKFIVSNGIAFSPDGRILYHTDSRPGRIDRYDFDAETGTISNRQVFLDYSDAGGRHPDGCTVDAEGGLWVAEINGWRVARYTPDGRFDRELKVPVSKPTSVMFGGADLSTLYITSMRFGLSEDALEQEPLAGRLLYADVGVAGAPEHEFSA